MINANDLHNRVGHDPYEQSIDQQIDYTARYNLDKLDEIAGLLRQMLNNSERSREKQAPTVVDLSPTSGSPISNTWSTKTRLRVIGFAISGAAGDQIALNIGTFKYRFYAGTNPTWVPFPIEIDVGIDLSAQDLTNPGATAWSLYVIGYTE